MTLQRTDGDVVSQIKQHPLSVYIGRDAKLERAGRDLRCCSPLRADVNPSFYIFDNDTRWHDFGTGFGGDLIDYVKYRDHCDFHKATDTLCEFFGIERKWKNASTAEEKTAVDEEMRRLTERHAVFDVMKEAVGYWHRHCPTKIKEFICAHYGLSESVFDRLQIGYSHGECYEYLANKGYSKDMLLKSGLFIESGDGGIWTFFQNRIIFPYWIKGQVVYLIGRQTEWTDTSSDYEKAKYKKALVHNERHHRVSVHIQNDWFYNEDVCSQKFDRLTITEGVTDCISLMQIDEPCISPVTVRFKKSNLPKLIELIKRCQAKTVYICNDSDIKVSDDGEVQRPGEEGALDTAGELIRVGVNVRVCQLPRPEGVAKVDLNEFCKAHGEHAKEAYEKVLAASKEFNDFEIERLSPDMSPQEKAARVQKIVDFNVNAHLIVRDSLEKKLKTQAGLNAATVKKLFNAAKPQKTPDDEKSVDKKAPGSTERVQGKIKEEIDHYYKQERNGDCVQISNFTIKPIKRLMLDKESLIVGELTNNKGNVKEVIFPNNSWSSRREFIRSLHDSRFSWKGSDDETQDLMERLNDKEVPFKQATPVLGYNCQDGIPKWIWAEGSIYADKFIANADADILYLPDGSNVDRRFKYQDTDPMHVKGLAASAIPLLLQVNEPGTILPIIGWFFATPYKQRLRNALGHFPILFVWGSMGSGKTSLLRDIFWALFGVKEQSEPYSCTDTTFAIIKKLCSTNGCPIVMDEHKPSDMPHGRADQIHRLIRRAYSGEAEERGRTDLSIQSSELQAPWCIAGETAPEDPATRERLLQVCPNRRFLNTNAFAREAFRTLRNLPLEKLTASYIQFTLRKNNIEDELKDAREWTDTFVKKLALTEIVAPRIYDNILCAVFGVLRFKEWAETLGVDCQFDASEIVRSVVSEHTEGSISATKDAFDNFMEYTGVLLMHGNSHPGTIAAPQKLLREGEAFAWMRNDKLNKTMLCLHLETCYRVYCIEKNRAGLKDETGGIKALKRLVKERAGQPGSYIVSSDRRVRMEGGFLHCVEVDPDAVRLHIRFPELDIGTERRPGG